jgi:hypothetical protein
LVSREVTHSDSLAYFECDFNIGAEEKCLRNPAKTSVAICVARADKRLIPGMLIFPPLAGHTLIDPNMQNGARYVNLRKME